MTDPNSQEPADAGLLDLIAVIVESWVLFAVGIAATVVCAVFFVWIQPTTYTTSATVALDVETASNIASGPGFIQPVIVGLDLTGSPDDIEDTQKNLLDALRFSRGFGDTTIVSLSWPEKNEARAILSGIISRFGQPKYGDQTERSQLEHSLEIERNAIKALEMARETLESARKEPGSDVAIRPDRYADALAILTNNIASHQARIVQFQRKMTALPDNIIISQPGPSRKTSGHRDAVIVTLSALTVAFLILVFVAARDGLRRASRSPATAGKVRRIRRAFGLEGRSKNDT